jgi:hypothetical protein
MKTTTHTAPPVDLDRLVLCIGRHANDGCGYKGGNSGGTCPECGGMLLSQKSINVADQAAREWEMRDAENSIIKPHA